MRGGRVDPSRWLGSLKQYKTVLLVLAAGVLLLLLPTGGSKPVPAEEPAGQFDLTAFEEKLERTLSKVEGAGDAEVMLCLSSEGRQVLAQDVERDGERTQTTTVRVGSGSGQEVVALQQFGPQFRGAVVVCPGGDDPEVRLELCRAVGALTGLGSDRITICKGN